MEVLLKSIGFFLLLLIVAIGGSLIMREFEDAHEARLHPAPASRSREVASARTNVDRDCKAYYSARTGEPVSRNGTVGCNL